MECIHVKNLEKYHPGYKDRELKWGKIFINMAEGDPDCEQLDEIDFSRFIKMILLELRARKPLPNSKRYWLSKGFDLETRPIELTLQMLQNFVCVVTQDGESCRVDKIRVDKIRVDKIRTEPDSPELRSALTAVYNDGFNIYALINNAKGGKSVWYPEEVLIRVCRAYQAQKKAIVEPWPWFIRVLKAESDSWFAQKSINEHEQIKKENWAPVLADIMKTAMKVGV